MNNNYSEYLPKDYFGGIYKKVLTPLSKGENVCISAIRGCGRKTFLNFFIKNIKENNFFENYYLYNSFSDKKSLIKFVKEKIENNNSKNLFIIFLFELEVNKRKILEEIQLMRQPVPSNNVFLIFTDHTGVTEQHDYLAISSPFFGERFYIKPFDLNQTIEMLEINEKFFGWKISPKLYREIFYLSGGIPRFIKHIAKMIFEDEIETSNLDQFILNPSINFELEQISNIISISDKKSLITLGILNETGKIKSGLLEYYFQKKKSNIVNEIYPNLTELEGKVFSCLYENKDKIVTINQIGDFLEMSGYEFSLWAIYKLLSRLKVKIKTNFEIENLKGRGYILHLI